jgi:hypothetical protein
VIPGRRDATSGVVDYQLRHLLPPTKDGIQHYYRFQTALINGASEEMDNTSSRNILALKQLAQQLIEDNDELLDRVVDQLLL